MYAMSQSYNTVCFHNSSYSPLESVACSVSSVEYSSDSGTIAYAVSSGSTSSYSAGNILSSNPESTRSANSLYNALSSAKASYEQSLRKNDSLYQIFQTKPEYHFLPDNFLKPGKGGKFVGRAEEIREHIEEAFQIMFNQPFPQDIKVSICDENTFKKIAPNPGTVGLSINRGKMGLLSEIFVLNGSLGKVMLTLGHELGHVLTETLDNAHDEEAKAYAFSLAWMNAIKDHNIAGLANAIVTETPAQNGLHNLAFDFVSSLLRKGRDVWSVYSDLISRVVSVKEGLVAC